MRIPDDLRKALHKDAFYWLDSIMGYAFFTGYCFRAADGTKVNLTEDDISTLGSSAGL